MRFHEISCLIRSNNVNNTIALPSALPSPQSMSFSLWWEITAIQQKFDDAHAKWFNVSRAADTLDGTYFITNFMSSRIFGLFVKSIWLHFLVSSARKCHPCTLYNVRTCKVCGYSILINHTYSLCINHSDNVNKKQSIIPMDVWYGI